MQQPAKVLTMFFFYIYSFRVPLNAIREAM